MKSQQVSPLNTKMGITWSRSISRLVIGKTRMSFTGLSTQRTTKTAATMVKCFHRNSTLSACCFHGNSEESNVVSRVWMSLYVSDRFHHHKQQHRSFTFFMPQNSWNTSCDAAAADMSHLTFISETYVSAFCLICKFPFKKRGWCIWSCVLTDPDLKKFNT